MGRSANQRFRGKQYENPNKCKPLPYVAMADICTASRPGQHKDPSLATYVAQSQITETATNTLFAVQSA